MAEALRIASGGCDRADTVVASSAAAPIRLSRSTCLRAGVQRRSPMPAPRQIDHGSGALQSGTVQGAGSRVPGDLVVGHGRTPHQPAYRSTLPTEFNHEGADR